MKSGYLRIKTVFIFCLIGLSLPVLTKAQTGLKNTIWDVPGIYKIPKYKIISRDSSIGLIYNGLPYHRHKQKVFAYYASPATLNEYKGSSKKFPGIVLVHGGGGRAFKEWAIMWAKKGYAAIAMDLRGNGPNKEHIKNGFIEENHETPYFKITPGLNDQWMYQAVADVILAHNLIRHFPEVDSDRTALTGIGWGGVITCIVAGLDNRFKAAVPVYGCGYLWQSGRMKTQLNQLTSADRQTWIKQYDPSHYIRETAMPILFLNDANDPYFAMRSYMKTYHEVKNKNLCIKVHLKHSHHAGWSNREIYCFINHYINHTKALPVIDKYVKRDDIIIAKVHSPVKIDKAFLHYTLNASVSGTNRKWNTKSVRYKNGEIKSPVPPEETTIWYLSLKDKRGLKVSGEIQFVKKL